MKEIGAITDKAGNEGRLLRGIGPDQQPYYIALVGTLYYQLPVGRIFSDGMRLDTTFEGLELLKATIPVVEEQLVVGKEVHDRTVRIHKQVHERPEQVALDLQAQRVHIERKPVGKIVEQAPQQRQEGDTLIVPVLEEHVVVSTVLYLKEEVHISYVMETEHVGETVMLRHESVSVEREQE